MIIDKERSGNGKTVHLQSAGSKHNRDFAGGNLHGRAENDGGTAKAAKT